MHIADDVRFNAQYTESWSFDDRTVIIIQYVKLHASSTWSVVAHMRVEHAEVEIMRTQHNARTSYDFDEMLRSARTQVGATLTSIAVRVNKLGVDSHA